MTASEALAFFRAALRAVAPAAVASDERVIFESGRELMEWATCADPAGAALVARLSTRQRDDLRQVLDGMLWERASTRIRRRPRPPSSRTRS